jgi:hypothetical protein
MSTNAHTDRFMREWETARRIIKEAQKRGTTLTLEQAHAVWVDHSDDYCAQWLVFDAADPVAEIWRAITKWQARGGKTT